MPAIKLLVTRPACQRLRDAPRHAGTLHDAEEGVRVNTLGHGSGDTMSALQSPAVSIYSGIRISL
jgi:hypothetical protein